MPASFKINSLPVADLQSPNDASGKLAKMVMSAGAGWSAPRMEVAWTYSAPEGGQSQTKYELEIAVSTTPTASGGAASSTIVSGEVSSAATTATPSPSSAFVESNYYFVRLRVFDGLEWSAWDGWFECRVRWALTTHAKDVNISGAAPTTWAVAGLHTTTGATYGITLEYNSSDDGTANLGSWKSDLSQVTKRKWVHYRAWFFAWGTSPATRASLDDITIQTTGYLLQPDFWLPSPISGEGGLVEVGKYVFGTQSLRMNGDGTEQVIRQQVRVEQNTYYMLQGRVESIGNSGARVQLSDTDLGASLHSTDALIADASFSTMVAIPWFSGERSAVWVQCRVNGAAGTSGFFDGIKMEKGLVASAWGPTYIGTTPGLTGAGAVVDAGGVQVDAKFEGIFRLRGSAGGARDIVELGTNGLKFGGATSPAELYSDTADELRLGAGDSLYVPANIKAASLALGANKVARYVPITQYNVASAATTTSASDVQTTSAEITSLPTDGSVVAIFGHIIAANSSANNGYAYAASWASFGDNCGICYAQNANINAGTTFICTVGGTNGRQMKYVVRANVGTLTYYIRVLGYWTTA